MSLVMKESVVAERDLSSSNYSMRLFLGLTLEPDYSLVYFFPDDPYGCTLLGDMGWGLSWVDTIGTTVDGFSPQLKQEKNDYMFPLKYLYYDCSHLAQYAITLNSTASPPELIALPLPAPPYHPAKLS